MNDGEMLKLQRHLKETQPELKAGSRKWWKAMWLEVEKRRHG